MKIMSVVGARPQFVKLAPISWAMAEAEVEHEVVHTGQHYAPALSGDFFRDLNIPEPVVDLAVGSGSHAQQTSRMLSWLEPAFVKHEPDCVLVYGDTNSTLAAALAASKMGIPIAHLEAGLRSFNRSMPEEINRIVTDHVSSLLLAPTSLAMSNLTNEGLADASVQTGDVMTDVCYFVRDKIKNEPPGARAVVCDDEFILATIHRPANTDRPERLADILQSLDSLPERVVLPAHPRLVARAKEFELPLDRKNISVVDPLPYPELISAAARAAAIVTDSGGLQKEAFLLRTPCVTVRAETEWVETLDLGWNILCPEPGGMVEALASLSPAETDAAPYGSGNAAALAVEAILSRKF
ncbi:UDP-N-acetylglucosamine 2-epimerase (non-hydrolyzing) [Dietzia cinnamea]|uniref:non-hydrolyzing UDP-N-acetylglucosamine 2-epimerase n=1 Tax=Dietzia cinnamea TaxID=321318 RepID=UPI00195E5DFB|nr:UDP-N-acetylglucosamine 2-epimerase (non-hydrolyzing) [Dietzia cinnamea]